MISQNDNLLEAPENFSSHEEVVLMAYYINKIRNQATLSSIEDAYGVALENFRKNPAILRDVYVEYITRLSRGGRYVDESNKDMAEEMRACFELAESMQKKTQSSTVSDFIEKVSKGGARESEPDPEPASK